MSGTTSESMFGFQGLNTSNGPHQVLPPRAPIDGPNDLLSDFDNEPTPISITYQEYIDKLSSCMAEVYSLRHERDQLQRELRMASKMREEMLKWQQLSHSDLSTEVQSMKEERDQLRSQLEALGHEAGSMFQNAQAANFHGSTITAAKDVYNVSFAYTEDVQKRLDSSAVEIQQLRDERDILQAQLKELQHREEDRERRRAMFATAKLETSHPSINMPLREKKVVPRGYKCLVLPTDRTNDRTWPYQSDSDVEDLTMVKAGRAAA
ncbi:hypothetical protein FA15DRAFT_691300 [Coprinopsis marcescibilis]|uniref:Uncharacterized protein n=1 Tax=Coprinopsis marcescibilis TaxID=230819 RepID=A0A5C3L8D7_COPMA|nr:hypothetical protein FA15DRAFT_691300 [Coprinopsis marcescibilis]